MDDTLTAELMFLNVADVCSCLQRREIESAQEHEHFDSVCRAIEHLDDGEHAGMLRRGIDMREVSRLRGVLNRIVDSNRLTPTDKELDWAMERCSDIGELYTGRSVMASCY